ncbi:hypothetical protein C8Q76DRAFT_754671 [Earliella scabrosa]|nr:hypothetical protein C8Q76DRAFT_754671 [Earliella scabrosa]
MRTRQVSLRIPTVLAVPALLSSRPLCPPIVLWRLFSPMTTQPLQRTATRTVVEMGSCLNPLTLTPLALGTAGAAQTRYRLISLTRAIIRGSLEPALTTRSALPYPCGVARPATGALLEFHDHDADRASAFLF